MIKIDKPAAPSILTTDGARKTADDCTMHDLDLVEFIKEFKADTSIYNHPSVKKALKKAQHNKCCFCEKDQVDEWGAVEHFRPKKGYNLKKGQKIEKPGYYWLTYDWDNLFFVCSPCNSSHKSNQFPLVHEDARVRDHTGDVSDEEPYLINPGKDQDISTHLSFVDPQIFGLTERGKRTIKICGLDRTELVEKRRKILSDVEARIVILSVQDVFTHEQIEDARNYIRKAMSPGGEFSAAVNSFLSSRCNIEIAS